MTREEMYKQDMINKRWTMPQVLKKFDFGKPVIAVFVSKLNWIQYEYEDHTRSKPISFTTLETLLEESDGNLFEEHRAAIRGAMVMRDKWIAVEKPEGEEEDSYDED